MDSSVIAQSDRYTEAPAGGAIEPVLRRYAVPLLLAAIIILAAAVRTVGLSDNPPGFFTDGASVGYNAYTILKSGKDEHGESWPVLFRAFGEYKLPVYIYSVVPFIAGFGLTELAVRLTTAAYGTLAVLTTYFLASTLFRRRSVGLAAACFLAIMPWHIHYSRTELGDLVTFLPFLTFGLYLFVRGARRTELWLGASAVLGLSLYTYRAAWVVMPPLGLALTVLYRRELVRDWRRVLYAAGILALIALPIVLHLLSDSGDRSQQAGILNLGLSPWETAKTFWDHYKSYFGQAFLFETGDNGAITRHYLPGFGELYRVQLPFIALAIVGIVLSPTREKMIALALLALYPLGGALSTESPISSRSILGTVAFAMLTGYGVVVAVSGLGKLNRPYGHAAAGTVVAVVAALTLVGFVSYLSLYHGQYPKLSAGYWGWQSGPKEIIEYYQSVEERYDQLIMDGEFNAPYMFFRFYAPEGCKGCTIGNTDLYDPGKRQLFALKPKNLPYRYMYHTVHEIDYPDGKPAFWLAEITGRRE